MKKIFYVLIRFIFSSYNLLYFRNFKVVGRENIPQNGGVLYSPNHQNALIDPLLVGTTATASIYSLTRSDVFGGPLQWFLDAMQTLPVYRIRDGYDKLKKNKAVFERCHQLLSNKENLMMFSEGKHHEEYYLLRLSKGSARLAMEAQLQSTHPIYIQPVGLNYGNHLHPRHDCTVVYGNSINVKEYLPAYKVHPAKGLNALRDCLQQEMEACLWYPKNDANYTSKKKYINRKNTPLDFSQMKTALTHPTPALALPGKRLFLHKILIALLSFPNLPVHLTINYCVNQFTDPVFHGSVKYFGGLIMFLLWWGLGIIGFTVEVNAYWGLSFFICSISSLYLRQFFVVRSL